MLIMIIIPAQPVFAQEVIDNDYSSIIYKYYSLISSGEVISITDLYGESLNNFVHDFFSDKINISAHEGVYNIKSVEAISFEKIQDLVTYNYNDSMYTDVKEIY